MYDSNIEAVVDEFLDASRKGRAGRMCEIVEENPTIATHARVLERPEFHYKYLQKHNPSASNTFYQQIRDSNIENKDDLLRRFDMIDILDELGGRGFSGVPAKI